MTTETAPTPITIGIVGLGRAGWGLHFAPISANPGYKITDVADPLAERTQEAAEKTGCRTYANIDELLAGSDAQVIVVATPSNSHYSDALKVLNAGRHLVLEKPIAMTACEANEIVALAKSKGLHLFVNHTHLHMKEYQYMQSVVDSGILGPIFHIRIAWASYNRRWDWQTLRKNGGGTLNNTCPHGLSIILPLLGAPVSSVYADLRNIKDAGDAEDHVHLVLKAENGTTADLLVSTAIAIGLPKWTIAGKYGTLQSNGQTAKFRYYDPAVVPDLQVLDAAAPGRQYMREEIPWQEKEEEIPAASRPGFHANILDVLVNGAAPIVTPESAAEVVRVTELAHQSAGL